MLDDMLFPDSDVLLVQVRPNENSANCLRKLVAMVKTFPEALFTYATAFFNATLRGAFSAGAPTVAYARQLLHARYVAATNI